MSRERSRATIEPVPAVERRRPWNGCCPGAARQPGPEIEALTPLLARLPGAPPEERHRHDHAGLRRGRAGPRGPVAQVRRVLHLPSRWPWPPSWPASSLDDMTIAAALLHDAVEDTGVTMADLEADFGPVVASIVDGVTKLERIRFDSKQAQQAATMRKMLVAMAKDPRGPAHQAGRPAAQHADDRGHARVEAEAHRAGDPRHLRPAGPPLRHPGHQVAAGGPGLRHPASPPLRRDRADGGHPGARAGDLPGPGDRAGPGAAGGGPYRRGEVTGRPKHLYSIYEKMVVKGKEFDEIYDLVGVRVLVESVKDCWAAARRRSTAPGRPMQGRFKDYINTPKFNLYQSLAHHRGRAPGQAPRGADPHLGDAQPGRAGHRRPLGLQGAGVGGRRRLVAAHRRLAAGDRPTPPSSSRR